MKKLVVGIFAVSAFGACTLLVPAQPGGAKGKFGKKGPPPFELGRILPPFIRQEVQLTEDQEKKIEELENRLKEQLSKILTKTQLERIDEIRKKGPKGPDAGGGDAKKKKGGPKFDEVQIAPGKSTIHWYATWESGLREAARTGRPIFLVSAAPHCAGIPGTW